MHFAVTAVQATNARAPALLGSHDVRPCHVLSASFEAHLLHRNHNSRMQVCTSVLSKP